MPEDPYARAAVEFGGIMAFKVWRRWRIYQRVVGDEHANPRGFYIWNKQSVQLRRAQPRLMSWLLIIPLFFAGVWMAGNQWNLGLPFHPIAWAGWLLIFGSIFCLKHHRPPAEDIIAVNQRAQKRDANYAAARYGEYR